MPIPDRGFYDTQAPTDSLRDMKQRKDQIAQEAAEQEQARQAAEQRRLARERKHLEKAREEEDEFVNRQSGGETREHLMKRLLSMRTPNPEPKTPPPLSPAAQSRLEAEQAAGRAAVARAQAEIDRVREYRLKREQEDAAREASLAPVVHPNPTMQERFPVTNSTIDKKK